MVTYSTEEFQLHQMDLQVPLDERGYLTDMRELGHKMGLRLHAEIFSKQPEVITYQPPAVPRSWWQRIKLRRGFGWLRRLSSVKLTEPERVDITGVVLYPGAAVKRHVEMGRPVMRFDPLEHPLPEGVEIEYAASNKRAVWLSEVVAAQIRGLAAQSWRSEEAVLRDVLGHLAHRHWAAQAPEDLYL